MTTVQVVETSVTVNNNRPIQDYVHPDDQTQPTFEMTPGLQGSQKFRIYPNSLKQKYDFNSCLISSEKAKYLNSDFKKRNDVLKIM